MIKLLKYNLNSEFESNKDSLNKLDNYVALTDDNQMVHLKNVNKDISYILKYKASNNPLFENIALFLTRADLYKSVKIDNQEISLSDKERIPYVCQSYNSENSDETMAEILYNTLLDSDTSQIKPKYNIYENYTEDKEGVIEVVFQENLTPQNIYGIFLSNVSLTSIPKDMLSVLSKDCTNMTGMFYYCSGLTSLDLSSFDTSMVTSMDYMFNQCSGLTSLDLSKFDTSMVTNMSYMFSYCSGLTSLDLSNFDTSKVTNMSSMFFNCGKLTSLDLSSFDTTNVTTMSYMFNNCIKLTHIKCKQSFKDWCWTNQNAIKLPTEMRDGGGGTWDIVDVQS